MRVLGKLDSLSLLLCHGMKMKMKKKASSV